MMMKLLATIYPWLVLALAAPPAAGAEAATVTPPLRDRAVAVLRDALHADHGDRPFIRVHAAEHLLDLDYFQDVRAVFERQLDQHGDEPVYRIGIWRVLARANHRPAAQTPWVQRIAGAFADETGPDRVHAAEALGKLGYVAPPGSAIESALIHAADDGAGALAAYARFVLANGDPARRRELARLLDADDVATRKLAAYALRHQPPTRDSAAALRDAALREPAGEARVFLLGAALVHAAPQDRAAIRPALRDLLRADDSRARYHAAEALGLAGGDEDLPALTDLLDDADADVRVAAAAATLRIGRRAGHHLASIDWAVIAAYAAGMLLVGWYFAARTRGAEDYLLGERNMPSWAVGLSLFATLLSTISILAKPGEIIMNGPMIVTQIAGYPIIILIVGWLIIPYIMRLKVTSAYEILEMRLGPSARVLGSVIFLLLRLMWMSVIIHATVTKVLVPLTGLPVSVAPLLCVVLGVVTVVYTTMGGFRAVVYTDVVQTLILFAGAVLTLVTATVALGGVGAWWPTEWSATWPEPKWGFQTDARVTFGWAVLSVVVWWVCTSGSDQMAIQRYLSTRDIRAARRALITSKIADAAVLILMTLIAFALFAYFRANPHMLPDGQTIHRHADQLFPQYIVFALPVGVTGIVIAAMLAAAMSSLSSGINSACSVVTVDFIGRFRTQRPDDPARHVRVVRLVSAGIGVVVVLLSTLVGMVSGNLLEVAFKVVNLLTVPLFMLFFMALFVPWATVVGAWLAVLGSVAAAVAVAYWREITGSPGPSFLWIMPTALLTGVTAGMLGSLLPLGPGPRHALRDLLAPSAQDALSTDRRP